MSQTIPSPSNHLYLEQPQQFVNLHLQVSPSEIEYGHIGTLLMLFSQFGSTYIHIDHKYIYVSIKLPVVLHLVVLNHDHQED